LNIYYSPLTNYNRILFQRIGIILSNKCVEFFILIKKRNNSGKGALNPLGWSETRKTEVHLPVFYPNPKYIRFVFYPNSYTPDPYLTRPPELTGLHTYIDTYTYIHTHTNAHIDMHRYIYICVCVCVCTCTHTCTYIGAHTETHRHMHTDCDTPIPGFEGVSSFLHSRTSR